MEIKNILVEVENLFKNGTLLHFNQSFDHKALDIAIIGYPNVGKSSIVNYLIGNKVRK